MSGLEARDIVETEVRRELFGPVVGANPVGVPLDCTQGKVTFQTRAESKGPFYDGQTRQELLTNGTPLTRYGIGVLHGGLRKSQQAAMPNDSDETELLGVMGLPSNDSEDIPEQSSRVIRSLSSDTADDDDFDLTGANSFKPSSMAISFQCRIPEGGTLRVDITGAYYDPLDVAFEDTKDAQKWWLRRPFTLTGTVSSDTLKHGVGRLTPVALTPKGNKPRIAPVAKVYNHAVTESADADSRLITIAIINDQPRQGPSAALFQMEFSVTAESGVYVEPYPSMSFSESDDEELSLELLYRKKKTYAIGHGCAAEWDIEEELSVSTVRGVALPSYEVVSLTPTIYLQDAAGENVLDGEGNRQPITVSMMALAEGSSEGGRQIEELLKLYGTWIRSRRSEILSLPEKLRDPANRHMDLAGEALARMREGWEMVLSDPIAERAFRLANRAMLSQQVRSNLPLRRLDRRKDGTLHPDGSHPNCDGIGSSRSWRPFQIAFILATLPELVDPTRENRSTVDLIFFPTGGGKTEAYLGSSAVSLLARRLRDPEDSGTDTIMRYTLRLLTSQQFLRAASLICVLEDIRSQNEGELGTAPFGIGVWLGGSSTPNRWQEAVTAVKKLQKGRKQQNPFLLLRCPWCGAEMGVKPKSKGGQDVAGYEIVNKRVVLRCPDRACRYAGRSGLPIHVIDEDIYQQSPSVLIGTVDKFAMLAWRPEARRIFGIGDSGEREVSPPNLIIQDELHLISGPLGSMVGVYEPIISELCTDRRGPSVVRPKIITSTATVRRYEEQVKGLYGREKIALFPPHGLEEGHSFFAEPDLRADGTVKPGRRYLGIMSASFGSMQTVQTRVAACTLQAPNKLAVEDRDGYWTNLNFFNSLRELGNTVSLLESDVPDYLEGLRRREGQEPRWPRNRMELTSRRKSDEIPKAIEQLQTPYDEDKRYQDAIDICLATNIIEVGIDIDRIGLMTIVGQPKTTAQYIQVSGRVGRRPDVSPGLVLTIYGAAKPRDRSHYERFYSYHQSLYAQVEPTSVTPFASPVLERALHAAVIAYVRQASIQGSTPSPFPEYEYETAIDLLRDRALISDPDQVGPVTTVADRRRREWMKWERTEWDGNPAANGNPQQGLMRYAGTLPSDTSRSLVWDVPTSMRNVDAECRLEISLAYADEDAERTTES